ncbi:hypothetical protein HZH66_001940 [Vespula vulgaris]|uniref:Uncharacterized protein n=1 Tax=Vespula vulgaris TaxID=7454 RepID=A0A834NHA4_VESVU|nr:hypothetical protein HZH66_001940 [Vespula vulgaris]
MDTIDTVREFNNNPSEDSHEHIELRYKSRQNHLNKTKKSDPFDSPPAMPPANVKGSKMVAMVDVTITIFLIALVKVRQLNRITGPDVKAKKALNDVTKSALSLEKGFTGWLNRQTSSLA